MEHKKQWTLKEGVVLEQPAWAYPGGVLGQLEYSYPLGGVLGPPKWTYPLGGSSDNLPHDPKGFVSPWLGVGLTSMLPA